MTTIPKLTAMLAVAALASLSSLQGGSCSSCSSCSTDPASAGKNQAGAKDIVALASSADGFGTLVAAIKAAGLVETLQGAGPFTVFAPTDEAFAKLPAGTVEGLLKPENREKLVALLTYHVVPGKVMASEVKTMQAKTVNGQKMNIKVQDGKVQVDNARVVKTDLLANNGVIHVIDTVILPRT